MQVEQGTFGKHLAYWVSDDAPYEGDTVILVPVGEEVWDAYEVGTGYYCDSFVGTSAVTVAREVFDSLADATAVA